jgi:type VI secretion system protein ImpM
LNITKLVGLYGKLPAHGDFIYRNLPTSFINTWDAWLQGFVSCSQEQLGDSWLDTYLTSPIWRFAFSEGVIDQHVWAGIVLPSVDRVGRYFPFSIAACLSGTANPLDVISQTAWFETIESLALRALEGQLPIDELAVEITQHQFSRAEFYTSESLVVNKLGTLIKLNTEEQSPQSTFSYLLNTSLKESLSSYSVWSTQGSQQVDPCLFYCRNLPQMQGLTAMLDGQWHL